MSEKEEIKKTPTTHLKHLFHFCVRVGGDQTLLYPAGSGVARVQVVSTNQDDLERMKRVKILRCAEFKSKDVVSLAFLHDSIYLLAQGGSPDYQLVYF